jgi:hypothetical protein
MMSQKEPPKMNSVMAVGSEEQRKAALSTVATWCPEDADIILEMLGVL